MINQAELAINDKARNSAQLQTLVYGCIIAHPRHERNEECTIAGRQILAGGTKIPRNVTSTSFNTVYLLPKDLRFEHGGAKLASCPARYLTSLRP